MPDRRSVYLVYTGRFLLPKRAEQLLTIKNALTKSCYLPLAMVKLQ